MLDFYCRKCWLEVFLLIFTWHWCSYFYPACSRFCNKIFVYKQTFSTLLRMHVLTGVQLLQMAKATVYVNSKASLYITLKHNHKLVSATGPRINFLGIIFANFCHIKQNCRPRNEKCRTTCNSLQKYRCTTLVVVEFCRANTNLFQPYLTVMYGSVALLIPVSSGVKDAGIL